MKIMKYIAEKLDFVKNDKGEIKIPNYSDSDLECARDEINPVTNLEWYCIDIYGNIGCLINNGNGKININVLKDFSAYRSLLKYIYELPEISTIKWNNKKDYNIYDEYICKRGIYIYELDYSKFSDRTHHKQNCYPAIPLKIDNLSEEINQYLKRIRINVDFSNDKIINL